MKFPRFVSYIFLLLIFALQANVFGQNNYFLSSRNGNDANNGTSENSPWKSISKLEQILPYLSPGDVIHFERGSIWHETDIKLTDRSGSESKPIVFKAYGTGARPVLSGSKVIESFNKSGNIFSSSVYKDFASAPMNAPTGILINGHWKDIARSEESLTYGSWSQTEISDPNKSWQNDRYVGSLILIQPVHWHWYPSPIVANSSNTLYFQKVDHRSSGDKLAAYYIANHDDFLKENGDWTFRDRTLKVFYNADLNQQNVQFAVSDTIISLSYCDNYEFQDIVFEMANFRHISVTKGSNIKIKGCEFRYTAGCAVKFFDVGDVVFTDNFVHDCGAVGLRLTYFGYAEVRRNQFKRIATQQVGMANYDFRMGAAITLHYSKHPKYHVEYNYFDSVGLAIQSHTFRSDGSASISYNYIENYGITISDCGAIYFNSDYGSEVQRVVKNNIIRNAISAGKKYPDNYHPVFHPHAIYIDDGALSYRCDSNTIENTSFALYMNRNYKNSFKFSNIVNANQDNPEAYNAVFMKDQAIGAINGSADRDSIMFNNIVLGDGNNPKVYLKHTGESAVNAYVDENNFFFDYNKVANPFNSGDPDFGKYIYNWGDADYSYTLQEMRESGGQISAIPTDAHSVINPQSIKYSDVAGSVNKEDFVKLYTNYSASPRTVNLGNASFRDIDGAVISGSIIIPPFYSRILFYQSGNINSTDAEHFVDSTLIPSLVMDEEGYVNNPPGIMDADFIVNQTEPQQLVIGTMHVTDPDDTQGHTFSISAGNAGGIFTINNSGVLSLSSASVSFAGNPVYDLTIKVTDTGIPSLSAYAKVTIRLIQRQTNHAPIIEDQEFEFYSNGEGTSLIVGTVVAYDPDFDELTYEIIGGEADHFSINSHTGEISIDQYDLGLSSPTVFEVLAKVSDNGSPSLSDEAKLFIMYIPVSYSVFIDPSAPSGGDGTLESPLKTLAGINFEPQYNYLVKRNSILPLDELTIRVDDIVIGAYGEGDHPKIQSSSSGNSFKIFDQKNITIRDIRIQANNAISAIYFVGPGSEDILISNCIIEGADYGLRFINTGRAVTKYCQFYNNQYGVYVIGSDYDFFYNVFSKNELGLNISVPSGSSKVYNNVFYNNREAINYTGIQFNLANNIFYLSNENDKAVRVNMGELQSDHNIFYPEREGFLTVDQYSYNSLEDIQEFETIDLNSMVKDPRFISPDDANFNLREHSPAIDAGKYVGLQFDILGIPIPMGQAPDIGTSEYVANQVSIEDTTSDLFARFEAYPNPAHDFVFVKSSIDLVGDETIKLYNTYGRLLIEKSAENSLVDNSKCYIDISSLSPGLYIISISGDDVLGSVKFMKGD